MPLTQTTSLAHANALQVWETIQGDPFSRQASALLDALTKLGSPWALGLRNRLLCYIHDIAVYKLGSVYGTELPADANPEHYFVAFPQGFDTMGKDEIPAVPFEDDAYTIAVLELALVDRYRRQLDFLASPVVS